MIIAIVGAGPAGAFLAEILSKRGFDCLLFDPRGVWEKPCGGGIPGRALERYKFLLSDDTHPKQIIKRITLFSLKKACLSLELDRPFCIYARKDLNRLLIERAAQAGARLVKQKVVDVGRNGAWRITTSDGKDSTADILIGADGANSIVRQKLLGPIPAGDFAVTLGYNVPGDGGHEVLIQFLEDFSGYLWAFPRIDHINFGVVNKVGETASVDLRRMINDFISEYCQRTGVDLQMDKAQFYGAKVPMLGARSWRSLKACGDDWALVGDAAGFVDPLTSEGIYFAMRSAEILADAIISGEITSFQRRWKKDFGREFKWGSLWMNYFYHGSLLGRSIIDWMIKLSNSHRGFRSVAANVLAGNQNYSTLGLDLLLRLPFK